VKVTEQQPSGWPVLLDHEGLLVGEGTADVLGREHEQERLGAVSDLEVPGLLVVADQEQSRTDREPVACRGEAPLTTDGQVSSDPVGHVAHLATGAPCDSVAVLILNEEAKHCLLSNADRVRALTAARQPQRRSRQVLACLALPLFEQHVVPVLVGRRHRDIHGEVIDVISRTTYWRSLQPR
jgi:hypothetical protein